MSQLSVFLARLEEELRPEQVGKQEGPKIAVRIFFFSLIRGMSGMQRKNSKISLVSTCVSQVSTYPRNEHLRKKNCRQKLCTVDRHTERQRQTDRQTYVHTVRQTKTQTDRQRQTKKDRQRQRDRQTKTDRHTYVHTVRQTKTERDRQTDRQRQERQTETNKDR